jgi:glycosyltransferase involved in cell wall biosynthesis
MASITALLHTHNDNPRIGRCLETLYPCDEIVVVDHGSSDGTLETVREYGARLVTAEVNVVPDFYFRFAPEGWIFCLNASESVSESLAASLFELKSELRSTAKEPPNSRTVFSVFVREETVDGWMDLPDPNTRLVPREWSRWEGRLPVSDPAASLLEGPLLRFRFP